MPALRKSADRQPGRDCLQVSAVLLSSVYGETADWVLLWNVLQPMLSSWARIHPENSAALQGHSQLLHEQPF